MLATNQQVTIQQETTQPITLHEECQLLLATNQQVKNQQETT